MKLEHDGPLLPLHEVEPGTLFKYGDCTALLSEYGHCEAYIVGSGEVFWGGTSYKSERALLMVQPLKLLPSPLPFEPTKEELEAEV